jgi:hypothetical protein
MLDRYALANFALRTDRRILRSAPPSWPVPGFDGRNPVVVDTIDHGLGVELAFERTHEHDLIAEYPIGGRNGTSRHFMPNLWPALAVSDGVVAYAGRQKFGSAVLIDHRNGWATYYANLAHLLVAPTSGTATKRPSVIKGGQILGFIGAPYPLAMKCLRFELWRVDDDGYVERINPRRFLYRWTVSQWVDETAPGVNLQAAPAAASEPRSAEEAASPVATA